MAVRLNSTIDFPYDLKLPSLLPGIWTEVFLPLKREKGPSKEVGEDAFGLWCMQACDQPISVHLDEIGLVRDYIGTVNEIHRMEGRTQAILQLDHPMEDVVHGLTMHHDLPQAIKKWLTMAGHLIDGAIYGVTLYHDDSVAVETWSSEIVIFESGL